MGADDDTDCVEHVWVLAELRLSVDAGAEQGKVCARCETPAYVPDSR